jgi:hypothetical protein
MVPPPHFRIDRILDGVVQREPPVNSGQRQYADSQQDTERVPVNRKDLPVEAVEQNAPGSFPRNPRKPGQDPLCVNIRHPTKRVKRQLPKLAPHCPKQLLDGPRLLAVETAKPKCGGDIVEWCLLDVLQAREHGLQVLPGFLEPREVGLEAEDDVNCLIQWVDFIAQQIFRRSVGFVKEAIQLMEHLAAVPGKPETRGHPSLLSFPML